MRYLVKAWVQGECESTASCAVIVFTGALISWLKTKKEVCEALGEDDSFHCIEYDDCTPDFIECLKGDEEYVESLEDVVYDAEIVKLEKGRELEWDRERLDFCNICVGVGGFFWRAQLRYEQMDIETPQFSWELLDKLDPEPQNNDGRTNCWWCGSQTEELPLATSISNACRKCSK